MTKPLTKTLPPWKHPQYDTGSVNGATRTCHWATVLTANTVNMQST